jgi:hypothetical protein
VRVLQHPQHPDADDALSEVQSWSPSTSPRPIGGEFAWLVALPAAPDLLLSAKDLFVHCRWWRGAPAGGENEQCSFEICGSQIALLSEAASALKDDHLGFTLARDHDPREVGLLYYVMASSPTLGAALQRLARYSKVTNEALVFEYREGNSLNVSLSYSGVPRHSDIQQMEF